MKSKNILLIVALLIFFGASGQESFFYLTATPVSPTEIELTWDDYEIPGGFDIYRTSEPDGPWWEYDMIASIISPPFNDSGLVPNTDYVYVVQPHEDNSNNPKISNYAIATTFALPPEKPRVVVSTDIGGGDFDDHQSLIHFLLYSNILDVRGFISSPPFGDYDKFTEVWNAYESDYDDLNNCGTGGYKTKEKLIAMTKKGYVDEDGKQLVRPSSGLPQSPGKQPLHPKAGAVNHGADLIVTEAKMASNSSPLFILAWGGLADVAQALFILNEEGTTVAQNAINNIRLYSIGSWNTENDKVSREYVYNNFSNLWWIESDATFFGMFKIKSLKDSKPSFYGDDANYGKLGFIDNNIRNHGELGKLYGQVSDDPTMNGRLKEGDSPSFLYMTIRY